MPRSTGGRRWSANSMGAMNRGPDSKVVEAGKVIANESVSAPVLGGHLKGNVTGNVTGSASALLLSAMEEITIDANIARDFSAGNNLKITGHASDKLTVQNTPVGSLLIIEAVTTDAIVTINTTDKTVTAGAVNKEVLLVIDAAGNTIKLN